MGHHEAPRAWEGLWFGLSRTGPLQGVEKRDMA